MKLLRCQCGELNLGYLSNSNFYSVGSNFQNIRVQRNISERLKNL